VYYFFQTFCFLTQLYAGSYETVVRISTNSANSTLKVCYPHMLARAFD